MTATTDRGDAWFEGFDACLHPLGGSAAMARTGGRAGAPPLLLLHGFPQTHSARIRVGAGMRACVLGCWARARREP